MTGQGWVGPMSQLLYYLDLCGADRDESGAFIVTGELVMTFMGMSDEALVPAGAMFTRGGVPRPIAAGLAGTSYGVKVAVVS